MSYGSHINFVLVKLLCAITHICTGLAYLIAAVRLIFKETNKAGKSII